MKRKLRLLEATFFSFLSIVFLSSLYHFLTENSTTRCSKSKAGIVASGSSPIISEQLTSDFFPYQTKCRTLGEVVTTDASKIRITGPFCGEPQRRPASSKTEDSDNKSSNISDDVPVTSSVENKTNGFHAMVLHDSYNNKFSTDFISLQPGSNKILMKFTYKDLEEPYLVQLTVIKK